MGKINSSEIDQRRAFPPRCAPNLDVWELGSSVFTPFLGVDIVRLRANIDRAQTIATANKISLRPHIKTHKCIEIARMQMEAGAVGITASKPQEALVFIEAGIPSVTVAYPVVVPAVAQQLISAARARNCKLRFVVDSEEGVRALDAAADANQKVQVFLEIDVGLQRCGVKPQSAAFDAVVLAIRNAPRLALQGILSHAGHAYAAKDRDEIAAIAADELQQMRFVCEELACRRMPVAEVSVGSTPTVLAAENFAGVTEIRPGNYVFLDATACRLGVADLQDVALGVVATVVSVNERYCIVDAGSKVLSSDAGPHGTGGTGFGSCFPLSAASAVWPNGGEVARLSEEHGFIEHHGSSLPIGTRVVIFPNHSCPAVNLADRLIVLERSQAPVTWTVAARGKTN